MPSTDIVDTQGYFCKSFLQSRWHTIFNTWIKNEKSSPSISTDVVPSPWSKTTPQWWLKLQEQQQSFAAYWTFASMRCRYGNCTWITLLSSHKDLRSRSTVPILQLRKWSSKWLGSCLGSRNMKGKEPRCESRCVWAPGKSLFTSLPLD